ncbi:MULTISPECIES: putative Ig domain-containing protein, partial [Thalassotalea]
PYPCRSITVSEPEPENNPPTISGTPSTSTTVNQAYSFIPIANDIDNDNLTFNIEGKPTWANFSNSTGQLSGTPKASDIGIVTDITISVTDGKVSKPIPLSTFDIKVLNEVPTHKTIFIHTDVLGTPVVETGSEGEIL